MSTTENRALCDEVEESLSDLLDGTAAARLYDHIAECDRCRDLKHEAGITADRVRDAGADFRPAADFLDQLVGRLEAARPATSGPKASSTKPSVTQVTEASQSTRAPSDTVVVRTGPVE